MAGRKIKMRSFFARDPRVIAMAKQLVDDPQFIGWSRKCPGESGTKARSLLVRVPQHVARLVVVGALSQIQQLTLRHCEPDGGDLRIRFGSLGYLDTVSEVPGIGAAMERIDMAAEEVADGKPCLRLRGLEVRNGR